ncbi:hypothetical protein HD554DRAFT_2329156 [Boletus coccyginus]|nr:hypothetical protein HD554DRAFT_2329156 [Boletus coccyginus]
MSRGVKKSCGQSAAAGVLALDAKSKNHNNGSDRGQNKKHMKSRVFVPDEAGSKLVAFQPHHHTTRPSNARLHPIPHGTRGREPSGVLTEPLRLDWTGTASKDSETRANDDWKCDMGHYHGKKRLDAQRDIVVSVPGPFSRAGIESGTVRGRYCWSPQGIVTSEAWVIRDFDGLDKSTGHTHGPQPRKKVSFAVRAGYIVVSGKDRSLRPIMGWGRRLLVRFLIVDLLQTRIITQIGRMSEGHPQLSTRKPKHTFFGYHNKTQG